MGLIQQELHILEAAWECSAHADWFMDDKTSGVMKTPHPKSQATVTQPSNSFETREQTDFWAMGDVEQKYGDSSSEGRQKHLLWDWSEKAIACYFFIVLILSAKAAAM